MSKEFVTAPADIQKLAHSIMQADQAGGSGRSTYLRSLVAVVQQTLGGKPVLRVVGRPKRPEIDAAIAAFEGPFLSRPLDVRPTSCVSSDLQQTPEESDMAKAEFQCLGNDLYWKFYDPQDGFIRWVGYDDDNWWQNVAPKRRDRIGEVSGRTYRINFDTNEVEVLP